MDDTRSDIAEKMRAMFQAKSPMERLKMGFSMHETSKYLVSRAIYENTPIYSGSDLRKELFLKFYGNDFDSAEKKKILDYFGTASALDSEEDLANFEHIPESEKKQQWWIRLYPVIRARLSRKKMEHSKLLKVLSHVNGLRTWKDIKTSIEIVLENVKDGESILARTAEVRNSSDPDGIIDDMFGELRTVPYLLLKGFQKISYSRREGLDFTAEFEGNIFHIESTYVHGPDFKTQEYVFSDGTKSIPSVYRIRPDKLIRLFERVYLAKKEQVMRYPGATSANTLIFMVTDLEESYADWLEHAKIQGVHPILNLILSCEIPLVIFGRGSVYEPLPDSLNGVFGKLQKFSWPDFSAFLNSRI